MGCTGYRDAPCECEDGGLLFDENYELLTIGDGVWLDVICRRCWGITDAVLHVDKGLSGLEGVPGLDGISSELWDEDD